MNSLVLMRQGKVFIHNLPIWKLYFFLFQLKSPSSIPMPRPATPSNCHKSARYAIGDTIWYLRHSMLRRYKVARQHR